MILHNLEVVGTTGLRHIHVENGRIMALADDEASLKIHPAGLQLSFDRAVVFPGLINSHDHLDFNLFPRLGNTIYSNYREWGKDIHIRNGEAIDRVKKVPLSVRIKWGLYKNLLNGFTTVVNHGAKLEIKDDLINVLQNNPVLHSPGFEKNWKWKLNNPFKKKGAFVMHIGEGTDRSSEKEISEVIQWNIFKRRIIAVHGVAMTEKQATSFAGLVWCPASNYFLLNKTAAIDSLKGKTKIVFGSDSTLTSPWNLWEQIRQAKKSLMLTENELMDALTKTPAGLWELKDTGEIGAGKAADLVVARKKDDFFSLDPKDILLVIQRGNIRMFDATLAPQLKNLKRKIFSSIALDGVIKYVEGDIAALMSEIKSYGVQTSL